MPFTLHNCLVVGISSRALFDLEEENRIFERDGIQAYRAFQRQNEQHLLQPGTAFHVIKELLSINTHAAKDQRLIEVVIMSRNTPDTGLRIFHSIEHYGLDITRAAFAGGEGLHSYLDAFSVDLFLSKSEVDVQAAINAGVAAAILCESPQGYEPVKHQVRIAFDGDAVLFSEASELIFQQQGLDAFVAHEQAHAKQQLAEGPFAKLLKTLAYLQETLPQEDNPFRLALVTARNSPSHERVLFTLREWGVNLDEAFFLGGLAKDQVLKAFRAHIFFDDQDVHLQAASRVVPAGKVPHKTS
ncbi:MAG: 5'-nucleotidase [Mariprofundaceae bacterium]|nr:5'-nucleotidase [Mariprofundaceae bacterium]